MFVNVRFGKASYINKLLFFLSPFPYLFGHLQGSNVCTYLAEPTWRELSGAKSEIMDIQLPRCFSTDENLRTVASTSRSNK